MAVSGDKSRSSVHASRSASTPADASPLISPEPPVEGVRAKFAVSLGLAAADPIYAGQIRAAQIAGIVRLTPVAMIASCLNAVTLLVTLHRAGVLRPGIIIWAILLFAVALYYASGWAARGRRDPNRPASHRAIRQAILHGVFYGALWAAIPIMILPGAPPQIQLFVGCLSAGMMCGGGFVLATVPLAGIAFVVIVAAGAAYGLLAAGSRVDLNLTALLFVYAAVVVSNLTWNAHLFVDHFLAAARLQAEIDARERTQAQMAHAQRMTALGQLAGGIAHDFNNILQAVAGSAAAIASHADDRGPIRALSARILEAAERGGAISRRLLAFALQDMLSAEPIDPASLLADTHELLRASFQSAILCRIDAPPGLPRLLADRAQLDTVLVNLTTNARDAMPLGGILTLRAAGEAFAADSLDPPLRAGAYVRLSIEDTGVGMDPATLTRATEPFFTTKPKGRGTGLGLSMAKGFAEQSGGAFAISSAPDRGTTVTLWLPQTDAAIAPPPPAPIAKDVAREAAREVARDHAARRHVLLVDDDELVRETMIESLAESGFHILGADSAPAALAHIDRGVAVDVLVSDFSMPGMNGVDLIRAAQARRPGLAAILLTGHVGDIGAAMPEGDHTGRFILLRKPIRAAELAQSFALALAAAA
jgi:signal transduction histidine kinase/ActR/RegA family two-component response regulator